MYGFFSMCSTNVRAVAVQNFSPCNVCSPFFHHCMWFWCELWRIFNLILCFPLKAIIMFFLQAVYHIHTCATNFYWNIWLTAIDCKDRKFVRNNYINWCDNVGRNVRWTGHFSPILWINWNSPKEMRIFMWTLMTSLRIMCFHQLQR